MLSSSPSRSHWQAPIQAPIQHDMLAYSHLDEGCMCSWTQCFWLAQKVLLWTYELLYFSSSCNLYSQLSRETEAGVCLFSPSVTGVKHHGRWKNHWDVFFKLESWVQIMLQAASLPSLQVSIYYYNILDLIIFLLSPAWKQYIQQLPDSAVE